MRINVYSQELTDEVIAITKRGTNTGVEYSAVQLILHSSPRLHHTPTDDDRSAITFWLPRNPDHREAFARALETMATLVRRAPRETGAL